MKRFLNSNSNLQILSNKIVILILLKQLNHNINFKKLKVM
jgi:hypothetical protein